MRIEALIQSARPGGRLRIRFADGSTLAANKKGDDVGHFLLYGILRTDFERLDDIVPTGIKVIKNEELIIKNEELVGEVYDLQGRRVADTSLNAGIYITSGKKFLVRK